MEHHGPRARLCVPGGPAAEGALCEVSAEGALLTMDPSDAAAVPLCAQVELLVEATPPDAPLSLRGMVVSRNDARDARTYGIWFLDPEEVQRAALPVLRALLDPRQYVRVTPAPGVEVEAWLSRVPGERLGPARLVDISEGGLGLVADLLTADELEGSARLDVCLQLPTWTDELELSGIIRHREIAGGSVRLGIEFDGEGDDYLASKREVIVEYVRRRQRELLGHALDE